MTHPKKYSSKRLMHAADLLDRQIPPEKRKPAPKTVLILMQQAALDFAQQKTWGKRSTKAPLKVYLPAKWRSGPALLGDIGVGGASVVAHLEYLAAWGVKQVVLVGVAGGLLPSVAYGDIVVPTQALRDEGVSIHYLPQERWALPSETLNLKIIDALAGLRPQVHVAPVWTTPAPFRETQAEVQDYAAEGMVAVEMETASLFAAAQTLGVAAAAVLVISDSLATGVHQMAPQQKMINNHLQLVCGRLIQLFKHPT